MESNVIIENKKLEKKIKQLNNQLENSVLERTMMEKQLNDNFRRQTILYEIYERTNKEFNLDTLIKETLIVMQNYLNVDALEFFLLNEDTQEVILHSSLGFSDEFIEKIKRRKIGDGIPGLTIQTGQSKSEKLKNFEEEEINKIALKSGFTDIASYPLKVGGVSIGAICVVNKNNREIDLKDQELLRAVSNQLGTALQNVKLFTSLNRELSERKRTEEELRNLTCAVEQSPTSVIITDSKGSITYANPKFTEITGYKIEEVLGKNPSILKSGKLSAKFYKDLWDTIKSGGVWHGEFLNKDRNGEDYWESASISPILNEDGVITHYVAVKEDITELKRSASELSKAKEEAEKANVAKSIFLANMSHEIRTPMNAILGFTQLMMRDKQLNFQQRQYLNTINISGEHLLNLINDILEMSKIDAGRVELMPVVFNMHFFVNDIKRMLEPHVLAKDLKLIIKIDENLEKYIEADEGRMRQIFINLIGNAIKFTDQGSITWSLKTVAEKNGYACLISEIEDTGAGILKEDIKKLFKAFEQTETGIKSGGTGLGLAISLKLAKMMGGEINVQSEKEKGSCFRVVLYVKKADTGKTKETVKYRRVIGIKDAEEAHKVLVVDDKYENRLLLCEMLKIVGFETQEASNGIEAMASFNEWSPNLILMDMRMPIMDGYETMSRIKATDKGKLTPIIAVTSSVFSEDKIKMIAAGAANYIRKPFKEKNLFEAIEGCIGVKYDYEEYDSGKSNENLEIDLKEIKLLPSNLIIQIKEAIINGDSEKLFELIDDVSKTLPQLANKLWELANDYKYEQLLKIFQ